MQNAIWFAFMELGGLGGLTWVFAGVFGCSQRERATATAKTKTEADDKQKNKQRQELAG